MSHWKTFGLRIFAALCLLSESRGSADAQCSPRSSCATEWSNGKAINLGVAGFRRELCLEHQ
jgi:hypothetical protein